MIPKKTSSEDSKMPKPSKSSPTKMVSSERAKECCMGLSTCSTPSSTNKSNPLSLHHHDDPKKGPKTRIVVKFDVGFNNSLYIRGKGAYLSWDKGIALKNVKADEWVWETDLPFTTCEFKVLINDKQYEAGENHRIACGANLQYSPRF